MAAKETDRSVTAIPRIYKGVRYASFLEMSRVFGIPVRTIISRWYRHRSMEMPVQQRAEPRSVTVDGITYPSIAAASRVLAPAQGITPECWAARWRLGLALNGRSRRPRKPKKDHNSKVVKFDGQYYPSITAMARELGLPFTKARALVEDQVV